MRRSLLVLFVFSCLPLFCQTKHPFTFEDMMKLKRVGEPVISPDGKWVLFVAIDVDLAANTKKPHLWVVATAGGQEREILADQDADRPRWAPDGKRFAFVSTKEGGSQIWAADFDGSLGTANGPHRLTFVATEAGGELWSPDGKSILFTSDVYPDCDGTPVEEMTCNRKKLQAELNAPVKARIFTHLLYRHWNAYKNGKRSHIFIAAVDACRDPTEPDCLAGAVRDLTPGDYDAPVFSLGGQDNYAFSPDGQEICYASNHDKVEAASTNNDLWTVSVNGGPAKNITVDNLASDSTPRYSPDGKYLAYRAQQRPGSESDRFRLMLRERTTGKTTNLTETYDRWVGSFDWAGSREIFFTAENEGGSAVYELMPEVCLERCHPLKVVDGYNDDIAASLLPAGAERIPGVAETVVFTQMSLQEPTEIFIAHPGSCGIGAEKVRAALLGQSKEPWPTCPDANPRQLTHLNESILSQVAMSPLESFWFPGAYAEQVEGFLVKPPNFDSSKKYPVKFLVHGGPEGAWGDDWSYRWNPELFAANGYVVIMINFHGSTGYGQKFIDAIRGDWGGAPFEDLMKGLDYAEKTYPFIDKARECALGASYGGYMANWILGHTSRFKCVVSHDGMFNAESAWGTTEELWFNDWEFQGTPYANREMYRKWSPHQYAKNFRTPTLVIHGQLDYRLDVSQGFDLFTTLQRENVPSKMLYFPDEGHWVLQPQNSRLWYNTVNDWVDQWVGN
jgi:dipeptidyl aminopeptidase/acylaminoacyl peptidase